MGVVQVTQGGADYLLGEAGAFATLGGNAKGFTHIAEAAAAIINGIANLSVSDTFAEANVH